MHNRKGSPQTPGADGSNSFQAANSYADARRFTPSNGSGVTVPAPKSAVSSSVPPPRSASAVEIAAAMEEDQRIESGLSYLIREEKLVRTNVPLSHLHTIENIVNGAKTETVALGIDGQLIIDRITAATKACEPLAPITVTTPVSLYNELADLENELIALKHALSSTEVRHGSSRKQVALKPLFVFDGAGLSPKLNLQGGSNTFSPFPNKILEMCGDDMHTRAGTLDEALKSEVAKRIGAWDEDVVMLIISVLKRAHSNVFIAPYVAWGQLAAFMAPGAKLVSDVWGSLELLAFPGVERVITRIDAEKGVMDVVVKQDVINAINRRLRKELKKFNEVSFGEWVMLDTIRPPYRLPFLSQPLDTLLERLSYSDSGDSFAKQQPKSDYTARIQANLAVLDTPVMWAPAGACVPLYRACQTRRHTNLTPQEAYGDQLPMALYFFLHEGHMLPSLWVSMGQHILVDRLSPLDTPDLRTGISRILTLRIHAANQISQCVNDTLSPHEWYREYGNDSNSVAKLTRLKSARALPLDDWPLLGSDALNAPEKDHVYFFDVLSLAKKSLPATENPKDLYLTVNETCAATLLKTLDLLGYYVHSTTDADPTLNEETPCSRALACFKTDTLSEYAVLFIELFRTGALHDNHMSLAPFPPVLVDGVRLACRTVSIIPLEMEQPWTGPVDVEMATFGAITRRYHTSIKTLVHAIATNLLLSGRSCVPWEDVSKVTERLPFPYPLEFGAGVVMQYILVNNVHSFDVIQRAFPEVSSMRSTLTMLFYFWHYAYNAMEALQWEIPHYDSSIAAAANRLMCDAALRLDPEEFAMMRA